MERTIFEEYQSGRQVLQTLALVTSLVIGSITYEIKFGFPKTNKPFERNCSSTTLCALTDAFEASTIARDYFP